MRASLRLDGLSVRVPSRAAPVLLGVDLELAEGGVAGVLGRSGCGKTTLLHAISGLVPWQRVAEVEGTVEIAGEPVGDLDPGQRAHLVASCLDRAMAQLFLGTAREEVAAARRLYGDSPLFEAALDELELTPLLDCRTSELSSGQLQRLALAVTLAGWPRPILMDEPSAHLDSQGTAAIGRLIEAAAGDGGCVVLADHAGWRLTGAAGDWWRLEDGRLQGTRPPAPPSLPAPPHAPGSATVVALRGVRVERGGRPLLEGIDLEIRAGEIVLLSGPNGAGKSTLAEVIAGFRRPAAGRVESRKRIALMLPTAELQLFAASVLEEVASSGDRAAQARVLRRHRLEHLASRAPWTLSRGERQRLVMAALDLGRPDLLVVDEPAQGLDPEELSELVTLIHRRAERGRAYLVISHREELAASVHRHLRVCDGSLEEAG